MAASTVLVVPMAPAPTGNGLAMRAGLLLEALAGAGPVDVVVVPVSGPGDGGKWLATRARQVLVVEPDPSRTRADVVAQLSNRVGRAEWAALEGLPPRARLATPASARATVGRLRNEAATVVVLRSYLAPFGVTLARELDASRIVIDADDDDERLLRAHGATVSADAYASLAVMWLAPADRVLAASPVDALAMSSRYGFAVDTLPNAVDRPATVTDPPGCHRLLYVGNLTYAPNVDAVRDLVTRVLPAVRTEVPDSTVTVVGAYDDRLADLGDVDGVELAGEVADLTHWYEDADLVVVPLREGAGTRIKVLEAFAHRRAVVATPAAVAGLHVVDGRSVHLGTTAAELAAQTVRLLASPDDARRTVDEADAILTEHYLLDVVVPRARRLLLGRPLEDT